MFLQEPVLYVASAALSSGNLIRIKKHERKPLNIRKKSLSIWVVPLSKQTLMRYKQCFRTLFVPVEMSFMPYKLPELLYFTCKYCYYCDNKICQSSVLLNLQELLQSVHNSITFKILPETEIDLSDHE
ncbi:hypothetical protein NC651_027910 [Populus alba x Populus x berolinensis]|nr:hypothetical protein NC651_027910 [Populus alba x Populus x berolinensis]